MKARDRLELWAFGVGLQLGVLLEQLLRVCRFRSSRRALQRRGTYKPGGRS